MDMLRDLRADLATLMAACGIPQAVGPAVGAAAVPSEEAGSSSQRQLGPAVGPATDPQLTPDKAEAQAVGPAVGAAAIPSEEAGSSSQGQLGPGPGSEPHTSGNTEPVEHY